LVLPPSCQDMTSEASVVAKLAPSSAAPSKPPPPRAKSPSLLPKPSQSKPPVPKHSLPRPSLPEPSLPSSLPVPLPVPAMRTRKAVKRGCKAELLKDLGEGEDLLLSPLNSTPPSPALSPQPPYPPPAPSPTLWTPPLLPPSSQGTPLPTCATPEHPSPTTTLAILSTQLAPLILLPAPLSWAWRTVRPQLLGHPHRLHSLNHIVCHKCCKQHYNFWWYSHCFMCHMDENRN
jgi:hypothetical protein